MKVFITHGHAETVRLKIKDYISAKLKHEPIILGEQPDRQGLTIIEALERFAQGCEFAIVLLTGDDMTQDGGRRARQNVIHEIGFFQGRLGRSKVVLIVEKGVEIPSNLAGLFYIEYVQDIKEAFPELQAMLDAGDASASGKELHASPCELVILGAGDSGARMIKLFIGLKKGIRGVYDQDGTKPGILEARKHSILVYVGWPHGLDQLLEECSSQPEQAHCFFVVAEHERFVAAVEARYNSRRLHNWTLLKKAVDFPRNFDENDLKTALGKCKVNE